MIIVPSGVYTLTNDGFNEDEAKKGDLDIDTYVVIRGAGGESTRIITKTGWNDRIFDNLGTVLIENIAISGGVCCGIVPLGTRGGAIFNRGRLTLRDVVVTGNEAYEKGGGIANSGLARSVQEHSIRQSV